MAEIADIKDRDSFQAWLEETEQPRAACVLLAHRAAMRVLPPAWAHAQGRDDWPVMPILRATLVVGIAAVARPSLLTDEGHGRAVRVVAAHAAAKEELWEQVRNDCERLAADKKLNRSAVFSNNRPDWFRQQ